jgi:hypothetical protein
VDGRAPFGKDAGKEGKVDTVDVYEMRLGRRGGGGGGRGREGGSGGGGGGETTHTLLLLLLLFGKELLGIVSPHPEIG